MLNTTDKKIVYLDGETLRYMYYTFTEERVYPVMKKFYSVLADGFVNNLLVTPLSVDHVLPYINEKKVEASFLDMMGEIGQVQFHQRFTIKTLQLMRIINHFFNNSVNKPLWRDVFTDDPDGRNSNAFKRYTSISAQNAIQSASREKNHSQIFEFLEGYKSGKPVEEIAILHFRSIWEQFPELVRPSLPTVGAADMNFARFLENKEIMEIPEFHIMATLMYPLIEAYGIEQIEHGLRDEELLAAETVAAYLPYCHYYITKIDIAEVLTMSDVQETYGVRIYDYNESSIYQFINDITDDLKHDLSRKDYLSRKSIFQKGGTKY